MAARLSHNKALRPLLRGLPLIGFSTICCVLAAAWYLRHATPQYESTARIRLADPHTGEASANLYRDLDVFANTNQIGTEVEMVKAGVLVEKTLDSIEMQTTVYRRGKLMKKELYLDNPLNVILHITDESLYGRPLTVNVLSDSSFLLTSPDNEFNYKGHFGRLLSLRGADILITRNDSLLARRPDIELVDKYLIIKNTPDVTVDKIIDNLDITSVDKDIPILRIIYKSSVPEKAAAYVNILSNTYISDYIESKYRAADITVAFLDRQLATVAARLSHSEDTIERFRTGYNIINFSQETETDLRKIAQMKIQLANLQMSLSAIDSLYDYMQHGKGDFSSLAPNFEAFTDLLSTELVKKIQQLEADKKDLLLTYTDKEEKVRVVDAKIRDLQSYLLESIANSRKDYTIKYQEMSRAIDAAETAFVGLPDKEKRMGVLDRDFGLNEKIYTYLHQKRTEAGIARAATISFHRIVAYGEVPQDPVSPKKVVILAVAAILGLLGSSSIIYTVHKAKAKVNDSETIEKSSTIPLAAEIEVHRDLDDRARHFADLTIRLELKSVLRYPAVVTVSSFAAGEGNGFFIAHLAVALARAGRKVLVFDITGRALPQATPNLFYLRARPEEPLDLAGSRREYDLVLICNRPVDESAEALIHMSAADTNLFLLDARLTRADRIAEASLLKDEFSIPDMRFILNRAHYNPSLFTKLVRRS